MVFTVTPPLRQTKEALTTEQMRELRPFLSKFILDGAGQVKQGAVEDVLRAMVHVSQGA